MENFSVIPNEVLRETGLNASEKLVYVYLMCMAGWHCNCFPSLGTISHELSLSRKTVSTAIKNLQDKKYITYVRRKGKNGEYISNYYLVANRCYDNDGEALESWKELYLSGLLNPPDFDIIKSGGKNDED